MAEKQKAVTKTTDNKPEKTPSQKAREFLLRQSFPWDSHNLLTDMGKLLDRCQTTKDDKKLDDEFHKKMAAAFPVIGLDTHYELMFVVSEGLRPLILEFARNLVAEYKCESVGEKAMAEAVVMSYARVLEFSKVINNLVRLNGISSEITGFYGMISKELDRANRHFLTALSALQQLKSPTLEVKVRAQTAIFGENQLFNTTQVAESLKADYEINKPK